MNLRNHIVFIFFRFWKSCSIPVTIHPSGWTTGNAPAKK
ncbi:hypothetical protein IMSAGC021_01096 [Muribaculaceae bacterium]|nr:hypothetical protein IMSAGC021_01096 [Muribaculaceae bacterium]